MSRELPPQYNPNDVEDRIYKLWEKSGFFNPDRLTKRKTQNAKRKTYCITVPPPNITGELHMGHALNATIQDILIRKKRMEGYKTLWLPGTDHAGIATQNVVEKKLRKEGKTRHDLGREKFLEEVWKWKEQYGNIILDQLKKLGSSMDWSRTRFTMDKEYKEAVKEAFLHYYKKGWIYQGERTVNWCTRCGTSLSDLEVEYKEEDTEWYEIKYGPLVIGTVRPETKLGDTAVAVNPKDARYQKYIGQELEIDTVLGPAKVKVVPDPEVDMDFGTGAMKVTPAHDIHDFEIAEKQGLGKIQVIGPNGKMTDSAGKYAGLSTKEARKQIVEDLEKKGLLASRKPYRHSVAVCYRCGTILEPLLSQQWFLKMDELAEIATKAVKSSRVKFHPKRWEKIYFDWLKNIKDWCISRQIWWGHKIPLDGVDDVLDTWFSSALWPFATLGWPIACAQNQKSKIKNQNICKPLHGSDLSDFYPTSVLSTARDIINLWVARMIFSGIEFMGREPCKDVIIHATILTRDGKRMSKSLGTGVDPMGLIDRYGADATRFGLIWQHMGNQDIHWAEEHVVAGRKFSNKIWNSARFVLMQLAEHKTQTAQSTNKAQNTKRKAQTTADRKILTALEKTKKDVNHRIEKYEFGQALHKLYDFFWHDFCDIYLEVSKSQMVNVKTQKTTQAILLHTLAESLKLLHPFMPFITEEIWGKLPITNKKLLIIEPWLK